MRHDIRWTRKKIGRMLADLEPLCTRSFTPLTPFKYFRLPGPQLPVPVGLDVDDSTWETILPDSYWGEWSMDFVLRSSFTIPKEWNPDEPVFLYLPLGEAGDFSHPEAMVYIDGLPYAACDRHHQHIRLNGHLQDGKPHLLSLHGWTGAGHDLGVPLRQTRLLMRACGLLQTDQILSGFLGMARLCVEVVDILGEHDLTRHRLLNALDDAYNCLDLREPFGREFGDNVAEAAAALQSGIQTAGASEDVRITAAGHAHLDIAWLWTVEQGRRKAGRTFSTALRLLEEFPNYYFTQSQPQLYRFVEQDYPELFQRIQQAVQAGRWEVTGGTWVEPDTNCVGSEALARQFLLGRGYFRRHFGNAETPVLFLPDTFGYSWALPQLIQQSGLKYFITHKLSWNQYNRMPFQSFWWQGIDGTRILTHFLTTPGEMESGDPRTTMLATTNYNALMTPAEMLGTWQNYHQKETHQELLTLYGYGDGGGGPTRTMLENMQRMADFPGLPRLSGGSVGGFMSRLEDAGERLPLWNGELYLELHRGTLTSQARTKRANRKNEIRLHDAEFLASLAAVWSAAAYPHADLQTAWELLCCNQFHDILPGSSIAAVYEDAAQDHARIQQITEKVAADAVEKLAQRLDPAVTHLAVNPTSFSGRKLVLFPGSLPPGSEWYDLQTAAALPSQAVDQGTLVSLPDLPAYSLAGMGIRAAGVPAPGNVHVRSMPGGYTLENEVLQLELNTTGELTRVWDKENSREVLPAGERANVLRAFEDRPVQYDAWDIDIYYEDKSWPVDAGTDPTLWRRVRCVVRWNLCTACAAAQLRSASSCARAAGASILIPQWIGTNTRYC